MVTPFLAKFWVGVATLCIALTCGAPVSAAGDLEFSIHDGRVTILARQVSIKTILEAWGRVGHTSIIDADQLEDRLVTLELVDVPENRALRTLLRDAAGYLAAPRITPFADGSRFDRILVLVETKTPEPAAVTAVRRMPVAPPQVSPAAGGARGRAPFTATAAQQEQLEQLQQLLQGQDGDAAAPEPGADAIPAFGTIPAERPGLPMRSADPNEEAAGVQTGAFGTTTPAEPTSGTRTAVIRRR
ncbi:MAG: hypothetical protein O3A25_11705 [Acidobacteria bacterium]|nr:hypothetical protein [Acidobacteriota bacterium]